MTPPGLWSYVTYQEWFGVLVENQSIYDGWPNKSVALKIFILGYPDLGGDGRPRPFYKFYLPLGVL